MVEGILFLLDLVCVTLLCIGIGRAEKAPADEKRLGMFRYDDVS